MPQYHSQLPFVSDAETRSRPTLFVYLLEWAWVPVLVEVVERRALLTVELALAAVEAVVLTAGVQI